MALAMEVVLIIYFNSYFIIIASLLLKLMIQQIIMLQLWFDVITMNIASGTNTVFYWR